MPTTGRAGFIGANAVEFALRRGILVCNLDCAAPRNQRYGAVWRAAVRDSRPTHALHRVARTNLRETRDLAAYSANMYPMNAL